MSESFLLLAAATGALSLLTPCVFPLIPITVAYFGQLGGTSRRTAFAHALLFALGIVATFTALGLGLAIVAGAAGMARLAANPWINLAMGAAFVAFALSLLGAYEIRVPFAQPALNRLDASARQRSGSALGSVAMGLAFSIASFTCTAPFVGPLLVAAARGEWTTPFAGMLVFSGVFAAPFLALALVPGWIHSLPRSGSWMQSVKAVVGLAELGAALKFFSNADLVWGYGYLTREIMVGAWLILALVAAAYLLLPVLRGNAPGRGNAAIRAAAGLACVLLSVWLGLGFRGASLGELEAFLPPDLSATQLAASGKPGRQLNWIINNQDSALALARSSGKLVFVDFTGYTCTNCRWMEANMFARPEVAAALGGFVLSRLYTDGEGEPYESQQIYQEKTFGTVALPLYAILDSDGRIIKSFSGLTRRPHRFLGFLRSVS